MLIRPEDPIVIRNAGGRVSDAIRTIAVMQAIIEPSWIVVMHHTGIIFPVPHHNLVASH